MSNIANTEITTNSTFSSTKNSTVAAANNGGGGGGSGLSMVQYAFLSITVGLVIEISSVTQQTPALNPDEFMLHKTYAASKRNRVVLNFIAIISTGVYDPETDICSYYQYPLSGFGYNAADLICDAFCTVVSIGFNCQYLFPSFGKIGEMIVKDNELHVDSSIKCGNVLGRGEEECLRHSNGQFLCDGAGLNRLTVIKEIQRLQL
ncbi:hypothetical protein BJ741DRAFT_630965 [Chytriomyces cf. hyalinus JEL632]|nr:hypothetical protein BJ741DRAFT_630965 [Chytriomyces cf. hyalinus JEL632]